MLLECLQAGSRRTTVLREMRELFSYHSASTPRLAQHDVQNVFQKTVRDLRALGFSEINGKRILDLGCGQRFPFALQCAAAGAAVTAADINYVKPDFLPLAFCRTLKHGGLKRAMKSAVRRVLWDKRYYRALEASAGKPLRAHRPRIHFIVADPVSAHYPLPSNSFDLIASNAVLEHVSDLPGFAAEVCRLLDGGGYFYAIIHNFYSLSGGHNLEWAFPDEHPSDTVAPWDHLRQRRFPAWTYLNRCTPDQYKEALGQSLEVLRFEGVGPNHDPGQLEGERLLTAEVAAELARYPRDLLLTRSWCMICRKA
jgi:SAM-dependent methyltransferase